MEANDIDKQEGGAITLHTVILEEIVLLAVVWTKKRLLDSNANVT